MLKIKEKAMRAGLYAALGLSLALGAGVPAVAGAQNQASKSSATAQSQNTQGGNQNESTRFHDFAVREVRHRLLLLPFYSLFDNLAYKVEGHTVTLLGQVTRPSLKSDAEAVVKKIEGVEAVKNEIQVLPLSPNDDRIRLAEYRAIYSEASFEKYAIQSVPPIHIIVDNGHVTLEGVVANQMDKNLAGIRANAVAGVFSVNNNLRVENQSQK